MQESNHSAAPDAATPTVQQLSLLARLRRLHLYFGHQRLAWGLAVLASLVGAATEPEVSAKTVW